MILSADQVEQLTGYKQKRKQVEALRKMGLRHYVTPKGRPIVDDSVFQGDAVSHSSPNFDAR